MEHEDGTLDVVVDERLRLAHELHDGPIQTVVSAMLELEALTRQIERGAEANDVLPPAERSKAAMQHALTEMRAIVRRLSPPGHAEANASPRTLADEEVTP